MTSNKFPGLNLRREVNLIRVFRESGGSPPEFTRVWMAASKSLMASCCPSGNLTNFSLRIESTTANTSASPKDSKNCRSGLFSLHLGLECLKWQKSQRTPLLDQPAEPIISNMSSNSIIEKGNGVWGLTSRIKT